ncbi:hypothetical protein [Trichormus sp. NMC-1]|uniref:hypothetical protein n=1 Tax=Trichormus sp. NMC-1 TaxID=1853259 RepID=UPI0015A72C3B|nr:hypothetical protein [Trichormus sp. NMC-1]
MGHKAFTFFIILNLNKLAELNLTTAEFRSQESGDASQTFGSGVRSKTGLLSSFQF